MADAQVFSFSRVLVPLYPFRVLAVAQAYPSMQWEGDSAHFKGRKGIQFRLSHMSLSVMDVREPVDVIKKLPSVPHVNGFSGMST